MYSQEIGDRIRRLCFEDFNGNGIGVGEEGVVFQSESIMSGIDGIVPTAAIIRSSVDMTNLLGVCLVPGQEHFPEGGSRLYFKVFSQINILFNDFSSAVKHLRGDQPKDNKTIVLGMNGYSSISAANCAAWGIKPGTYEAACRRILEETYKAVKSEFPLCQIALVHGASDMGVDLAIKAFAKEHRINNVGFSCPRFLFYVEDSAEGWEKTPLVYVADTQADYGKKFIEALDILLATGGRKHALDHDITACFLTRRRIIVANVLKAISINGGAPAFGPNGEIEDAVAAFEQLVHVAAQGHSSGPDTWKILVNEIQDICIDVARRLLAPDVAY